MVGLARVSSGSSATRAPAGIAPQAPIDAISARLSLIDSAHFLEFASLFDRDNLVELLQVVRRCLMEELLRVELAAEVGDMKAVREATHKIVGMAGNYGIFDVSKSARQIFVTAQSGELDAGGEAVGNLRSLIDRTVVEIDLVIDAI